MQIRFGGRRRRLETPEQMVRETSAFLTWALPRSHRLPRVPTRPVHQGGFASLLSIPGARQRLARWWAVSLETVEQTYRRGSARA
ncbi:MAG: hypothetical protein AAGB29_13430 [Planctomycetota bacterium]